MWPLAYRLRAAGFDVRPWRYPSLFASIELHAARLYEYLSIDLAKVDRVHIVAHSMGSIITRAALQRGCIPNLGRIVLLAPPNGGSPIARVAAKVLGGIIPPTRELSDDPATFVHQVGASAHAIEIGILAARFDFLVPEKNTHLSGELEHQTLLATHNSLLFTSDVVTKIVNFLHYGCFEATTLHR